MYKLFHPLAIAALALALPLAALADTNLNLDTGATGSSGGDIVFNPGTSIAPVGSAKLDDLTTAFGSEFSIFASSGVLEQALASGTYSTTPIPSSSLVVNEVIAVHTNGGNYAGVLVTAASSGSITLQYITYNTSGTKIQGLTTVTLGGPAAPTITSVQNNYSFILPNAPNYGISPGTLVLVSGNAMATPGSSASPLQDPSKALPQTWNGASVSVTVGSTTVHPAFYYAIPSYLGIVIPSNTPVGTGTITVSYGGQTSAPLPITIVPHSFGFDSYGGGLAVVTDAITYNLITPTNSAKPGEILTFWGAGDGADTNNDDLNPPTHFDNLSGITAFYFGSVQVPAANILYQGRSGYQGVDQINVTIPANPPTGCAVSVVAVSGSVVSNFVTLPIATNGGTCTDPLAFVDPTVASTLAGKTTVKFGGISVDQSTDSSGTTDEAGAFFYSISGSSLAGYSSSSQPSLGSCFVTQTNATIPVNPFTLTGLDAGSVSVQGPTGTTLTLTTYPQVPGIYAYEPLPAGYVPASGGTFTFTGTGGTDVGAFTGSVVFPSPLVWTNSGSDGTVTRANGIPIAWTGGSSGTYVEINGYSASTALGFSASFRCDAPVGPGSFTVPPAVLLALPAGSGSLVVSNYTNPRSVAIPNVDFGYSLAYVQTTIDATYN